MERHIPIFMTEKRGILHFLTLVFILAALFSFVYRPNVFIRGLEGEGRSNYYVLSLVIIGYIIMSASRFAFYKIHHKHPFTFQQFCWWIVLELIFISLGLSLVGWSVDSAHRPFLPIMLHTSVSVVTILALPYTISWLYFALQEKKQVISEISSQIKLVDKDREVLNFYDEKGVFRISIRIDDFLYAQSADNYIYIFYLNNRGEKMRFMLRNSLKSIEESFSSYNIHRCHRFYVVNFRKVRVLRKSAEGLLLELDSGNSCEVIPVSKTYATMVAELFSN